MPHTIFLLYSHVQWSDNFAIKNQSDKSSTIDRAVMTIDQVHPIRCRVLQHLDSSSLSSRQCFQDKPPSAFCLSDLSKLYTREDVQNIIHGVSNMGLSTVQTFKIRQGTSILRLGGLFFQDNCNIFSDQCHRIITFLNLFYILLYLKRLKRCWST